jgi:hypothetical protein
MLQRKVRKSRKTGWFMAKNRTFSVFGGLGNRSALSSFFVKISALQGSARQR